MVASFIIVMGLSLFIFQHKSKPQDYVFSFEDSLERIYQELGNNPALEVSFDSVIESSINENLKGIIMEDGQDFYDNPFFWESLTEEEMMFLDSELNKETKFLEESNEKK